MQPKIVSPSEWVEARKQSLIKEKEFTRLRDELSRERRELPWERVVRRFQRQGEARRSVRRPQSTRGLSLHVRARLGGRLSELFVRG